VRNYPFCASREGPDDKKMLGCEPVTSEERSRQERAPAAACSALARFVVLKIRRAKDIELELLIVVQRRLQCATFCGCALERA
jgi:hypothetical protein